MKGKVSKLLICMIMVAFLVSCGNNQSDVPVTDSQVQEKITSEGELQESSVASPDENREEASSTPEGKFTENTESSEESTKESTEPTLESVEAKPEEPSEKQESVEPSKEPEKSSEAVVPSQEASKPSSSTPSVEQTQTSQEQAQPSTPAVHTCSFDGGTVTTAATCKAEGVKTYSCSCGKTKTESITKTSHNYVSESQAATCSVEGYERTKCSICGDVKSETVLSKTDHSYYEFWWHEPDCTYPGYMHLMLCHNCDFQQELPLGALGHMPDAGTVIHPGTCTGQALIAHSCIRCGATMESTWGATDPNNHNWIYDEEYQIWGCSRCHTLK